MYLAEPWQIILVKGLSAQNLLHQLLLWDASQPSHAVPPWPRLSSDLSKPAQLCSCCHPWAAVEVGARQAPPHPAWAWEMGEVSEMDMLGRECPRSAPGLGCAGSGAQMRHQQLGEAGRTALLQFTTSCPGFYLKTVLNLVQIQALLGLLASVNQLGSVNFPARGISVQRANTECVQESPAPGSRAEQSLGRTPPHLSSWTTPLSRIFLSMERGIS